MTSLPPGAIGIEACCRTAQRLYENRILTYQYFDVFPICIILSNRKCGPFHLYNHQLENSRGPGIASNYGLIPSCLYKERDWAKTEIRVPLSPSLGPGTACSFVTCDCIDKAGISSHSVVTLRALSMGRKTIRKSGKPYTGAERMRRSRAGKEVASISLLAEADRLSLSYTLRVRDGEWEEVVQTIPIAHLRCRFGGNRPFFICPGDGTDCGR